MRLSKMGFSLVCFCLLSVSFLAFAQVAVDPNQDFINLLASAIGSFKGAGTLAIVALVVQLLIKLMSTSWFGGLFTNLSGAVKLLIVNGLGMVGSVVALMGPPNNMSFLVAISSGAILSGLMVYGNQLYQHFFQKQT